MRAKGWADLHDWRVDRASQVPIFRQVYQQIRSAILARVFPPGTKLPSTRELALRLWVARSSVVSAYQQLFAEGYLSGKIGSGSYVSPDFDEPIEGRSLKRLGRPIAQTRRLQAFREF